MILLLLQHTYLPISMWKLTISLREGWFLSGTCFLPWLRLHFLFGVNWKWICWHPGIPINVSSINPWRVIMLFLLMSRMPIYIFIVQHHHWFLCFILQHKPYQWKVLPFQLAMVHRVFTSLTKPILFPYPVVASCLVLGARCILPCKNSRL